MEEVIKYMSVWGWQLMSMIFLVGALVASALPPALPRNSVLVALVLGWIMSFYMMLKRKKELTEDDGQN